MSLLDPFADMVRAFSDDDLLAAYARAADEYEERYAATLHVGIGRRGSFVPTRAERSCN